MTRGRKLVCALIALMALLPLRMALAQESPASIAGQWEGESLCTVPSSPCHNEHVLYEISRAPVPDARTADAKPSRGWKIDAHKIVNGEKQFMGTLFCSYDVPDKKLRCSANLKMQDHWEFSIDGEAMRGTLVLGPEKTLYRRVSLKKSPPNKT